MCKSKQILVGRVLAELSVDQQNRESFVFQRERFGLLSTNNCPLTTTWQKPAFTLRAVTLLIGYVDFFLKQRKLVGNRDESNCLTAATVLRDETGTAAAAAADTKKGLAVESSAKKCRGSGETEDRHDQDGRGCCCCCCCCCCCFEGIIQKPFHRLVLEKSREKRSKGRGEAVVVVVVVIVVVTALDRWA